MKKDIETILSSMDFVEEQNPSAFFKEKVVRNYQLRKEEMTRSWEDWFPWMSVKQQLVLTAVVVIINIVSVITISNEVQYQRDLKTLSLEFNMAL